MKLKLWNGETLSYPAPIADLRFVESHGSPSVQVADLIAGALSSVLRSVVVPSLVDRFAATLRDTPALEWIIGGSVWPTDAIEPDELGAQPGASPWLADEMAQWLADAERHAGE